MVKSTLPVFIIMSGYVSMNLINYKFYMQEESTVYFWMFSLLKNVLYKQLSGFKWFNLSYYNNYASSW